ncbi:copper transport protein ATX1-like [Aristolochia californica]|uniref:copper transport protein ATX1-like n=1 Tax=Aristolochia californica TaxID=171875 RepID=UPI0035E33864
MAQTVVLNVGMSCEGCVGAVKRVLTKMEGVDSFDVDLKEQKVTVKGNVQPEAVLQTVSKTGKKTAFWEAPTNAAAPQEVAAPEATSPPAAGKGPAAAAV